MRNLCYYFGQLRAGKTILWCYLIWYLAMASFYFDPRPSIWLNSLGISVVIGCALILSVMPVSGIRAMDKWAVARLFMMPFAVSSFAALIKDHGFFVVFSPRLAENAVAGAACVTFVALTLASKAACKRATATS